MSQESMQWLNANTLIGYTDQRGRAWLPGQEWSLPPARDNGTGSGCRLLVPTAPILAIGPRAAVLGHATCRPAARLSGRECARLVLCGPGGTHEDQLATCDRRR
jgi:hypothetical protein